MKQGSVKSCETNTQISHVSSQMSRLQQKCSEFTSECILSMSQLALTHIKAQTFMSHSRPLLVSACITL